MKFCVIGLGRFGYQVATALAENGMEVMAIESDEAIVASIRDAVTQAICMQVTDESSLRSVGVDEMDTVIVAMGENFAESILITALLKKRLLTKKVITRAVMPVDMPKFTNADVASKKISIKLSSCSSSERQKVVKKIQKLLKEIIAIAL